MKTRILRQIIIILLALALPIGWLIGTNLGLKVILSVTRQVTPVKFNYATVNGRIIDRKITLHNLKIEKNTHTVEIARLDFDWVLKAVRLTDIKFPAISPEILINQAHSTIIFKPGSKQLETTLTGLLNGYVTAAYTDSNWQLTELKLNFAKSKLNITPTSVNNYRWNLNLIQLQDILNNWRGAVTASGNISLNPNAIVLTADINATNLGTAEYAIKHLQTKTNLLFNKQKLWHIQTTGNIKLPSQNYIQTNIALQSDIIINNQNINGDINLKTADLALIMHWVPDITRLKGLLVSDVKINGTLNKPVISSKTSLTNITATVPSLGIKIKPMELHLNSNVDYKFILTGKGKMRRGSGEFTINGFIEPFKKDIPNAVRLVGKDIEFVNNNYAKLTASNDLTFIYHSQDMRLDINGNINIQHGKINFLANKSSTVKSKDIVFIDTKAQKNHSDKKHILFNPDINLRISDGVHFTGFGLDADVTGKLAINQRHDNIYGDGRITIKQGTFQLPGQKLDINHGRLLYPPGTLLANPSLDLKMLSDNNDLELHVNGTASAPIIRESGNLAQNQEKALSQAILTGGSLLSKNLIQDKLKLTELGVAKNQNPKDKDIVIGRHVGKKLYLQYLHSMNEENDRLRLKYDINKNWYIGVESGKKGGGADIGFAIERD